MFPLTGEDQFRLPAHQVVQPERVGLQGTGLRRGFARLFPAPGVFGRAADALPGGGAVFPLGLGERPDDVAGRQIDILLQDPHAMQTRRQEIVPQDPPHRPVARTVAGRKKLYEVGKLQAGQFGRLDPERIVDAAFFSGSRRNIFPRRDVDVRKDLGRVGRGRFPRTHCERFAGKLLFLIGGEPGALGRDLPLVRKRAERRSEQGADFAGTAPGVGDLPRFRKTFPGGLAQGGTQFAADGSCRDRIGGQTVEFRQQFAGLRLADQTIQLEFEAGTALAEFLRKGLHRRGGHPQFLGMTPPDLHRVVRAEPRRADRQDEPGEDRPPERAVHEAPCPELLGPAREGAGLGQSCRQAFQKLVDVVEPALLLFVARPEDDGQEFAADRRTQVAREFREDAGRLAGDGAVEDLAQRVNVALPGVVLLARETLRRQEPERPGERNGKVERTDEARIGQHGFAVDI